MNYAEQIAAFEADRAAKVARQKSIMDEAGKKGETLDAAGSEEFDNIGTEIEAIDKHLKRLRSLEKSVGTSLATPAAGGTSEAGTAARGGTDVQVKRQPKLEPGIGFARIAKCLGMAKGAMGDAMHIAQARYGDDSDTVGVFKAAVAAGSTLSGSWAEDLVGDTTGAYADFVEFLRPQTILGKFGTNGIPSLRKVPFRVPLVAQTAGGAGYWVGEGQAKPLTAFDFSRTTMEPLKVANIAVLTEEVIRDSSPSAEAIIRDSLRDALVERLDIDFIDPAKAAVAGVSPASILNGSTDDIASSGTDADAIRLDVRSVFARFILARNAPSSGVWIMSANTALALSLMVNPLGQREFPGISMTGGTFEGLPAIISEYAGNLLALVNASDIYLADEGGIAIDLSREASLQMADNPTHNSTTPTAVSLVSMFQTNSVAFRAERTINWARRRPTSVAYLTGVAYGGAVTAPTA
jgi:hypothetical protein